jgi:predicted lysophospholipase L1 biosynthesis ABC-type transport system permease subunit
MVNRTFAETFFAEGGALGERVGIFGTDQIEIIGVVGDSRFNGLDEADGPMIYYNFDQWADVIGNWVGFYSDPDGIPLNVVIRASGEAASLESLVRREMAVVDPTIPITRLRTMEMVVQSSMAQRRLLLLSIGAFAVVGLLLGALGTYAVLSYALEARIREMGIRLALGATPSGLLRLTTLSGLRMTGLGLVLGVGGALALSRTLQGLLFGVAPNDPASYVTVALVVLAVATAACWVPARRAASTDPVEAFRSE